MSIIIAKLRYHLVIIAILVWIFLKYNPYSFDAKPILTYHLYINKKLIFIPLTIAFIKPVVKAHERRNTCLIGTGI